ncbi:MAG: folate hydrolase [Bacteroidetes bacterium]|nr:MAG: folate hydrolase [Bacteroidota bacterium]
MRYKHLAIAFLLAIPGAGFSQTNSISGFGETSSKQEATIEGQFDGNLSAQNISQYIKEMSARPHHVGSPGGKQVAEYILNKFKSWGYDAKIESFFVLFPTPKERVLEMTAPTKFKAGLKEMPLKEDATSGQAAEQLPTYNCWSADGDVTGQLVFVNYGVPEDYEMLERLGIDVKGKIVIAKYGHSWRGIKPKVAQEHGAIGCIIYSDPADDGYFQGDVYPKGAYKNETGVQRGSVLDMPIYPGDPLTPGSGAVKDAKRLDQKEALNLLKIPVLPISYKDALPLLKALEGEVAPESWRGALPITYHVGPGKATVHLKLSFDWQIRELRDVIAKMPGSDFPDQWVIRGNHHDAWVNGASDPLSGQASMLEEARSLSVMAKSGWKPKRTIIFCAWDGEEPGLLGSTEWAEEHWDELQDKAVTYINTDASGRGFLYAEGSHALEGFVNEIARDITDPQTKISVLDRRRARDIVDAGSDSKKKELIGKKTISIGAMGSGSDYSPFIQHLGISSLNYGYGGEDGGGEYHSIYDSYDDYRRFKDPTFEYGVALAKTAGHSAIRLANCEMLPFDFRTFFTTVKGYANDLISMSDQMRENTELENQIISDQQYKYAADPTEKIQAPSPKSEVPFLNFSNLQNSIEDLDKTTSSLSEAISKAKTSSTKKDQINKSLYQAEQKLLTDAGLPRRPWYKHTIYAPGLYTGYGVKTLPGIREAIEQRNWKEAQQQIEIAANIISKFNAYLKSVTQQIQ